MRSRRRWNARRARSSHGWCTVVSAGSTSVRPAFLSKSLPTFERTVESADVADREVVADVGAERRASCEVA
jgi:hypothetical protein